MIGSAQIRRLLLRCKCRLPVVCIILHPPFTSLFKNPPGGSNRSPLPLLYRFSLFLNKVNNDPRHALFLADVQLRVSSALNAIFSRRQGTDIAPSRSHPWSHVVIGMWHKYPNPHCSHVVTVDVVDRSVDPKSGVIRTERILGCKQKAPVWIVKVST